MGRCQESGQDQAEGNSRKGKAARGDYEASLVE